MINRQNLKDFMVIDRQGKIIYADVGNPGYFEPGQGSLKGKSLYELYPEIGEDYPALVSAREGKSFPAFQAELTTMRGITLRKNGCAYPIYRRGEPAGAVEFANFIYDKTHIGDIESHAEHMIYRKNNTRYLLEDIITGDEKMQEIKRNIEKYAISDSNVLIYGETGTGKELVAQSLHNCSRRYQNKFLSLNCGAIPQNLVESILFGVTKGSFTGAEDTKGLFEQAEGGTLFLDEINSLDVYSQVKIFRAVEDKMIRRIGSDREFKVDVRIIAATNEEPTALMKEGRLKPDLYYRLSGIYIKLPRLSDRGRDILLLSDYFIRYFNGKMNDNMEYLSDEIKSIFMDYSWPGNVRELKNAIEGAVAFAEGNRILPEDIPDYIRRASREKIRQKTQRTSGGGYVFCPDGKSLTKQKEELEEFIVRKIYAQCGGNLTVTADKLKISKQLLYYKLNKYNGEK